MFFAVRTFGNRIGAIETHDYRAARVVGLEGRLVGSAVATGDDAETIAMVAVAIKA